MEKYSIAIVDDHNLVAKAFTKLLHNFEKYQVLYEVSNGKELIEKIHFGHVPDLVLLDVNMPVMNGYETAIWLKNNYPRIKILALSMNNEEQSIIGMLRNGVGGYVLKDSKPSQLKAAIDDVMEKGFHYSEYITNKLIQNLNLGKLKSPVEQLGLNEREMVFLQHACSDLIYSEIADKMCLSTRTIDGYRESVFQKMGVKSRVSMVVEAIKLGLINLNLNHQKSILHKPERL